MRTGEKIQCKICKELLPGCNFSLDKGMLSCRSCLSAKERATHQSKRRTHPFEVRLPSVQRRAGMRGLQYDLTVEWAQMQWNKQQGRCEYTRVPMELAGRIHAPLACSFDRVNSELGYTQDNVVMCCSAYNSFKGKMTRTESSLIFEAMATGSRWDYERAQWLQRPQNKAEIERILGIVGGQYTKPEYQPAPTFPKRDLFSNLDPRQRVLAGLFAGVTHPDALAVQIAEAEAEAAEARRLPPPQEPDTI